jgi:GT2 family glycosyltransferase
MTPASFAVVVAEHRNYATLELCLHDFRGLVARAADLIFVDNGSGGALTTWAREHAPGISTITLTENRLFCGGYNAGIRAAMERGHDYVLIANADTEVVNPGFVANLIDTMQRYPRAAFVGPLVYYRDRGAVQTTCLKFPSLWRSLLVWLPYRLAPSAVTRQPAHEHHVDFLNGVCVLCRVAALREIGLMDERFGAYVEDTDWAWRARQRGWVSLFTPVPSLIHHEETTGYEPYSFKNFLLRRNTVYWLLKAGRRRSARWYATAAIVLARLRAAMAPPDEQGAYRDYARRLRAAYRHLLAGEALGPWFGPPMDSVTAAPGAEGGWSVPDVP